MYFFLFVSRYFIFSPNECTGLCPHRTRAFIRGKIKYHEIKDGVSNIWLSTNFEIRRSDISKAY